MTVEQLEAYGMEQMREADIEDFLVSQRTGVLGLAAEGTPYLVPLSFGYDGGTSLYFTYVAAPKSRKARLSDRNDLASFLVYSVESAFNWRSVLLTGTISEVPESEWGDHAEAMSDNAWHPDLFERAKSSGRVLVYRFSIEDWSGLRHAGLPPGFGHEPED